ncbi:MAG: hypothetical protein IJF54_05350 [Clostridia bacterium]|nr:hypothetical protein [Clostridia bacterium]
MKKIDATVLKETAYIAAFTVILSALMQSVFLIIGKWDYTVLLGNTMGIIAAAGNFLLMGITVQSALGKEQKQAADIMKLSQTLRMLLLFVIALIGYLVPVFNVIAVIIPYIFPRIAVALRPAFSKKQ